MPYEEKFKDRDFLNALSDSMGIDTQSVASKVQCSYEEAKQRLRNLMAEGKVIGMQNENTRRTMHADVTFKWYWMRNSDYKEPEMNPDMIGLHFYDRGTTYVKAKFAKFANACAIIANVAGLDLLEGVESEFSDNKVFIGHTDNERLSLNISQVIYDTRKCLISDEKKRYIGYADTGTEAYNLLTVACLISLKYFFPQTKLSLGVNNDDFEKAIELASVGIQKIDKKRLLRDMQAVNRASWIQKVLEVQVV